MREAAVGNALSPTVDKMIAFMQCIVS